MRGVLLTTVLALLATAGGCTTGRGLSPSHPEPRTALTAHQLQVKRLEKKIAELEAERDVLKGKVEQVEANERRLFLRLRELQFANDRQADQIEHLATVPLERDRYKAQAESLAVRIVALQRTIARLEMGQPARPPAPPAATTPAAPAAPPKPVTPATRPTDDTGFRPPVRTPRP